MKLTKNTDNVDLFSPGVETRIKKEKEEFENYLQILKEHFLTTKDIFLRTESFPFVDDISGINYITNVYHSSIFFADVEIIEKFRKFGIKRNDLRWLMPIEELKKNFADIENVGVALYQMRYMEHLMTYLSIFISLDVLNWAELTQEARGGVKLVTTTSGIENAIERIEYGANRKYKPSPSKEIHEMIAKEIIELEKEANLRPGKILSMLRGAIDRQFLLDWLTESFPYTDQILKSTKFLKIIQPLNKMVFKNKTEPDIDQIGDEKYSGKSLQSVQAQFWRKWFYKT